MPNCICLGWASSVYLIKKTLAWEETLEIRHDNRNFYERKTNQKECPD